VLTNISNEHLDYHKTYDNYLNVKSKLLTSSKFAVVNADDKSFKKITNRILSGNTKLISYSNSGLTPQINKVINKRFSEPYNQMNSYAAVLAVKTISNLNDKEITEAIRTFPGVPGRMEEIKNRKGIKLIVDFAHTTNGLLNVLQILRNNSKRKLYVVFGCAGERDYKKRPEMGRIATQLADFSVFTAEDPRHEQLTDIFKQMKSKLGNRKNYIEIEDRKEAITYAINHAKKGDTVVICGKGPEKSMAFGDIEIPWSDIEITRKIANE
jgi:UDP-N-acetylmuramoyl-L-alanyl-D-glutamate--2,6-diaminopimelate ligase